MTQHPTQYDHRRGPAPTDLPHLIAPTPADPTEGQLPRRAFVEQVMGLPMSLHIRGAHAHSPAVGAAVDTMLSRLRADDAEFSTYKPDSAVSRIRRGELAVRDASPRLQEVVRLCDLAAQRTDGAFRAWLPGTGHILFDPTGLVKGWAVQEAFERLKHDLQSFGSHDALMSAGGDVVVACTRTDTPDWVVAVEDPTDTTQLIAQIRLRAGAVATSGTAARGAHILNPRTGAPATGLLSATVVGPGLMWADVYATALLAAGGPGLWWDSISHDHHGLIVSADGTANHLPLPLHRSTRPAGTELGESRAVPFTRPDPRNTRCGPRHTTIRDATGPEDR